MKWKSINQYECNPFFKHYYTPDPRMDSYLFKYEWPLLDYVIDILPSYIENVVIFGCASGRDFIPFYEKYKCYGFDIESGDKIQWVCPTEKLFYYQCSMQDFIKNKNTFDSIDFSKSLVYTQGTLMYLTSDEQDLFVKTILGLGCKNFVIHEYPPTWEGSGNIIEKFNPSKEVLDLFEEKHFRASRHNQPTGFLIIDRE